MRLFIVIEYIQNSAISFCRSCFEQSCYSLTKGLFTQSIYSGSRCLQTQAKEVMLKYFNTKAQLQRLGLTTEWFSISLRLAHGIQGGKRAFLASNFPRYYQTNGLSVCQTTLQMLQKNVLFVDQDSIVC